MSFRENLRHSLGVIDVPVKLKLFLLLGFKNKESFGSNDEKFSTISGE
ncbi:MAG: hypothetical protein CM15mP31_0060 [Gammaproteobacteria bacterium]|nr:MAG: hypothetical protein CM15mP31_0060 [Gammaproteobacteria bacterium]